MSASAGVCPDEVTCEITTTIANVVRITYVLVMMVKTMSLNHLVQQCQKDTLRIRAQRMGIEHQPRALKGAFQVCSMFYAECACHCHATLDVDDPNQDRIGFSRCRIACSLQDSQITALQSTTAVDFRGGLSCYHDNSSIQACRLLQSLLMGSQRESVNSSTNSESVPQLPPAWLRGCRCLIGCVLSTRSMFLCQYVG